MCNNGLHIKNSHLGIEEQGACVDAAAPGARGWESGARGAPTGGPRPEQVGSEIANFSGGHCYFEV
jgi:hypothetical protein